MRPRGPTTEPIGIRVTPERDRELRALAKVLTGGSITALVNMALDMALAELRKSVTQPSLAPPPG
jgi:hypothetical protein